MNSKDKLKPKLFSVMKTYSWGQFGKDVVSGIIVAIIALPLSIALALASGVGPEEGIYTAIFAGFLISFFGGSRVQIAGPTAAFATIVAGIVATNGMDGLVVATMIAGVILILQEIANFDVSMRGLPPIQVGATQMEDTRVAYYASTRKSIWFNIDYIADKNLYGAYMALLHELNHLEQDMIIHNPEWENQEIFTSDTVEKMREEWAIYKPSTVDEDFYYQSFIETVADERASSLYNEYWELYIKTYTNATITEQKGK